MNSMAISFLSFSFEPWPFLGLPECPGLAVLMSPSMAASATQVAASMVRTWLLRLWRLQWRNALCQMIAYATAAPCFSSSTSLTYLIFPSLHLLFQKSDTRRHRRDEEFWMVDNWGDAALYVLKYPLTIVPRTSWCRLTVWPLGKSILLSLSTLSTHGYCSPRAQESISMAKSLPLCI